MAYSFLPTINTTNQTSTNAPGGPQAGALNTIYGGLANAYSNMMATGPYRGEYVAAPNATQYGAYNQAGDFARNFGSLPGQQIAAGQGLMNNYGTASNAAGALYNFGSQNQTQNNINTANAYANNPFIDQAVAAATSGARKDAQNAVTNLYRSAAPSGNINSDRSALIQGKIEGDLAENAQNIGANMRFNMFNTGLNTALTQNSQGMGALSNAGSLSSNLGGAGSSMMSQGINDQMGLSRLYESAGSGLNDLDQSVINNNLAKFQGNQNHPWDALRNYYGIAGNQNWWGSQNTTGTSVGMQPVQQQSSPGLLSYLGAGLGLAGSAAGLGMGGGATLGGNLLSGILSGRGALSRF